jgi:large subunit ribosomal protein L23
MKLTPLLTEKSLSDAKSGSYTFLVDAHARKEEIKKLIEAAFDVHVTSVRTSSVKGGTKKNMRGQMQTLKAAKKAWVSLAEKEKISMFEEKTK